MWYVRPVDRRLRQLLDLLDEPGDTSVGTSMRLPASLRDAATLASAMGFAPSATQVAVRGLRDALEAFAQRRVLDEHYRRHPQSRPDLAEIALALAELDGRAIASRPDLITRAARDVATVKDEPSPDDVLLFAAGLAATVA
jgi:hypothetical protein